MWHLYIYIFSSFLSRYLVFHCRSVALSLIIVQVLFVYSQFFQTILMLWYVLVRFFLPFLGPVPRLLKKKKKRRPDTESHVSTLESFINSRV